MSSYKSKCLWITSFFLLFETCLKNKKLEVEWLFSTSATRSLIFLSLSPAHFMNQTLGVVKAQVFFMQSNREILWTITDSCLFISTDMDLWFKWMIWSEREFPVVLYLTSGQLSGLCVSRLWRRTSAFYFGFADTRNDSGQDSGKRAGWRHSSPNPALKTSLDSNKHLISDISVVCVLWSHQLWDDSN